MISGLLTLLLLIAPTATEAPDDLDQLLAGLEPGADAQHRLRFTETRDSELTDNPLVVTGTLWRDEQGRLVRQTRAPRQAVQRLGERMVVVERPNRSTRRFRLERAPELAVIRHALMALLAGDANALRQHFDYELNHSEGGWRLVLTPRERALAKKVDSLSLSGHAGRIERFELSLADGTRIATELERHP